MEKTRAPRTDFLWLVLAVVLLFSTVFSLFSSLNPKSGAEKALANQWERQADDPFFALFSKAWIHGEISLQEEGAEQPRFLLSSSKDRFLLSRGGTLAADGKTLVYTTGDGSCSFPQSTFFSQLNAAGVLGNDALFFAVAGVKTAQAKGVYSDLVTTLTAAFSSAGQTKEEVSLGGKSVSARVYRFAAEEKALQRALNRFFEKARTEETASALFALQSALSGLCGEKAQPTPALQSALSGETDFADLTEATGEAEVLVYKNKAVGVRGAVTLVGEASWELSFSLRFADPDGNAKSGALTLKKTAAGEERVLTAAFTDEISENSKSAYVRKGAVSLSDPGRLFLQEKEEFGLEARFAWGKQKNDIGLNVKRGDDEWVLRGEMTAMKAGKTLSARITGLEKNKEEQLGKPVLLSVEASKKLPALPGEGAPFDTLSAQEKAALFAEPEPGDADETIPDTAGV